jgi:hypothetical protein
VKFDIGDCYENLSRKSKSVENWVKMLGTLSEDLSMFYSYWQQYIAIKAFSSNKMIIRLSVHLHVSAPTGWTDVKFDTGDFCENL